MTTETRTVQTIARAQAAATFIEPEHSIMLALCDRLDALEKALGDVLAAVETRPATMRLRKIFVAARAALSPPSDNSDGQAGSMK